MAVSIPGISSSTSMAKESHGGIRRSRSEPLLRCAVSAPRASATLKSAGSVPRFLSNLPKPVRSVLFETEEMVDLKEVGSGEEDERKRNKANWIEKVLELRRRWRGDGAKEGEMDCYCSVSYDSEEEVEEGSGSGSGEEVVAWDRDSFARLLARVPWTEAKLFCQLAYLCNMAYVIPEIKEDDLKKYYGLRFVTSSLEKKFGSRAIKSMAKIDSVKVGTLSCSSCFDDDDDGPQPRRPVRTSVVYQIAAVAASYVHSRAQGLLSIGNQSPHVNSSGKTGHTSSRFYNAEMAAYMAASTVTAVVAAQEDARKMAAEDLSSEKSSPCEWFVCDDRGTRTRNFIIQGSDSLESWQANLFFEPTEFEETGVLVHRGIYEAAKGMYRQLLPEISSHIQQYGDRARLRFSGHSLGGSLALLVSLMLLTRGAVKRSQVLPVVTFGAPSVFCGGQKILEFLGLQEEFVRSVMMHRDIVPRAFSCSYPKQVAMLLKRLNGAFRIHHCLNHEKLLYSPLGKTYIVQPDEKLSPPHPFLPEGPAFYMLEKQYAPSKSTFTSAVRAFLNSPHPLETLSDMKAYGSDGAILRDHESSNYFRAIDGVLRLHTRKVVSRSEEERLMNWWPLLAGHRNREGIAHRRDFGKELVAKV
ncbi:Alpha/beta-Hydrolases superfamily protein [Rhynchospora pubera]|uniref:Alpha/beta-Hydrolases superfamily protein n=1 Tax=Rhynchospora pubera TaxID=906938 RepID=A0AAV8FZM8_9POAL|nr:Alpha/beta-Hydrolases superfamily protein [Rhynchospora pubera]